jgi:hypothetical protein
MKRAASFAALTMRGFWVVFLWLTNMSVSFSQEFLGMRLGNYSGVHGLMLNPAVNVNGPKQYDVNFFAMGFAFESNYIFLERSNMFIAGLKAPKLTPDPAIELDRNPPANPLYFNYFDRKNQRYNFYANAFVAFPGAMFNYLDNSFGLFFNNRVQGYAHRISTDYGYYYYKDSSTTEMFLDPMKLGLMHYGELCFNYGRKVASLGILDLNVGATAKYIMPWDGVFLRNNLRKEAIKIENGVKIPEGADVDFNWSSNYRYDYANEKPIYDLQKNGNGFSFDLGATLVNPIIGDPEEVIKWRIGVALQDIGRVWFNKRSETNRFYTTDTIIYRDEYFTNVKDLDSFRAVANFYNFGNYDQTVTGDNFRISMQSALSIFGDYNLNGSNYISMHAIVRLPQKSIGLERSNILAFTYRIEKEHKEFTFPFILYDFRSPRVGFYFRRKYFFIGSDNMTSWLIPQRLRGTEFYMGFKWSGNEQFKKKGKLIKCPVW